MAAAVEPRSAVDVVVPFGGDRRQSRSLLEALAPLRRRDDDTVVVADNTPAGVLAGIEAAGVEIVVARGELSSYHARNVGASVGRAPWILFLDSDCIPATDLLDRYLALPLSSDIGILAGRISAAPGESLAARYAASRGHVGEGDLVAAEPPAAPAANLMVRRRAFTQLGGFTEGMRSGADLELCGRAAAAGWRLRHVPEAEVAHRHPDDVATMLAKARRYGAGRAWLERLHPGWAPRPGLLRPLARAPALALIWLLRGDLERARFKVLDARHTIALRRGYGEDNRARPGPRSAPNPAQGEAGARSRGPSRSVPRPR